MAWLVRQKVNRLRIEVDGRLTELLRTTRLAAGAEGELKGRMDAHDERTERDA